MRIVSTLVAMALATLGSVGFSPAAHAGSKAADSALSEFREGTKPYNVVMNRFFLKSNRFEVTPALGYVPNNPFVKRYVGGVMLAYHFTEELAAEGAIMYAPDLGNNDLKDLTFTLVNIAHSSDDGANFQQPLNKMILGATFAARWAPVYGKINLIGEQVVNFDFYGTAGLGMLSIEEYYAKYDPSVGEEGNNTAANDVGQKVRVPVNVGLGFDFFLTNSMALKIDGRSYFYVDKKPDYNADDNQVVEESRLYNNFIASVGLAFFFPSMPARLQF